jgi:hypothetical protein
MIKIILTAIAMATAISVSAKGSSHAGSDNQSQSGGIITTSVATGVKSFIFWTVNVNGDTVVCNYGEYNGRREECGDKNMSWRVLKDAVPKGKTYVGFRVSNHRIEVYWK